ncbi:MAG: YhcH/YjgK/YiaL family protein [Verrucomicrobiota bacterium]
MIPANLNDPQLESFLLGPIWAEAFGWIKKHAANSELGIHQLRGESMFVNVQSYATEPRENCRFESHRRNVDLQYTIEGLEGIDYLNRANLESDGEYDPDKDLLFHKPAAEACTLRISGSGFCVFFPGDAQRPKVALQEPALVRKLVVKIDIDLLM